MSCFALSSFIDVIIISSSTHCHIHICSKYALKNNNNLTHGTKASFFSKDSRTQSCSKVCLQNLAKVVTHFYKIKILSVLVGVDAGSV